MTTVDRLLRDLVAIDSVNPTLVPGAAGEAAIAQRLVQEFEAIGVPVEVQEVAPGRPNVVATLEGRAPGRSLMLCGHIDTVGVAGMTSPFTPLERDGRLHGRGAQDMKSGVAAMVDAVRAVADGRRTRRWPRRRRLRGRRGALEHRRRCAGDALARRCRGGHRADRSRHRRGAQGLRVVGDRHRRPRRPRQPPGRGCRRDRAHGAGAERARGARSRAAVGPTTPSPRDGVAARVAPSAVAASSAAIRISARCRSNAARCPASPTAPSPARSARSWPGWPPPTRRSPAARGRSSHVPRTRLTLPIPCPDC